MGTLPILKPRQAIRMLERIGFEQIRQRGSHRQFRHPDGRQTTVPDHGARDLSPIILRQIIKDIGLTTDEFLAHR